MSKKSSTPDGLMLTRALTLLPANHMLVWAELRKIEPAISPSEVYRLLANDPRVKAERTGATTRFSLAIVNSQR